MERLYTVTLRFNPNKPYNSDVPLQEHDIFIKQLTDYLHSLDLFDKDPEKTVIFGSHLMKQAKDGGHVDITHPGSEYALYSMGVSSATHLKELEAIKYALTIARRLELALPSFQPSLTFDPNAIGIFVGENKEGEYMLMEDFIPSAKELQRILFGGGKIAYSESSGHFTFYLGVEERFQGYNFSKIIDAGGIQKPAGSLEELLQRMKQNHQ